VPIVSAHFRSLLVTSVSCSKTDEPFQNPFGMWTRRVQWIVLGGRSQRHIVTVVAWSVGLQVCVCVCLSVGNESVPKIIIKDTTNLLFKTAIGIFERVVSCSKTDEPFQNPFGMWTRRVQWIVLGGRSQGYFLRVILVVVFFFNDNFVNCKATFDNWKSNT